MGRDGEGIEFVGLKNSWEWKRNWDGGLGMKKGIV
jgi:hypothetical protein